MPNATTKVFICYKKELTKVDGEKTVIRQNTYAETIAEILKTSEQGFDAWFDEPGLPAGIEWENAIYTNLLDSDVVLVVAGPGTAQSECVKREIALARAFGISVFPLGVDVTMEQLTSELTGLGIGHLQGKL